MMKPAPEDSEYIRMMNGFFVRTAMWKSKTKKEVNWLFFAVTVILLIVDVATGSYTFVLNKDDFYTSIEILFFMTIALHSLFICVNFIYKHRTANRLMETLTTKFQHFEESLFQDSDNVWLVEEKKSMLQTKICICLTLSTYVMYFYQSNFFTFDFKIRKTLYPKWMPFPVESPWYFAAMAHQVFMFYVHLNVCLMSAGLFAGSGNLYGAMTDSINRVLRDIGDLGKFKVDVEDGEDVARKYLMRRCIEQHLLLKRFEKDLNFCMGVVFLELVFVSELLICFSGYQLLQAAKDVDIKSTLKTIFTVAVMVVQIYVYCWFGEKIYSKSSMFTFNLYCCQWYKWPKSFRTSFRIILLNTAKAVTINPYGIVNATLNTFIQTLKAAFSFLNLLIVLSTDKA